MKSIFVIIFLKILILSNCTQKLSTYNNDYKEYYEITGINLYLFEIDKKDSCYFISDSQNAESGDSLIFNLTFQKRYISKLSLKDKEGIVTAKPGILGSYDAIDEVYIYLMSTNKNDSILLNEYLKFKGSVLDEKYFVSSAPNESRLYYRRNCEKHSESGVDFWNIEDFIDQFNSKSGNVIVDHLTDLLLQLNFPDKVLSGHFSLNVEIKFSSGRIINTNAPLILNP